MYYAIKRKEDNHVFAGVTTDLVKVISPRSDSQYPNILLIGATLSKSHYETFLAEYPEKKQSDGWYNLEKVDLIEVKALFNGFTKKSPLDEFRYYIWQRWNVFLKEDKMLLECENEPGYLTRSEQEVLSRLIQFSAVKSGKTNPDIIKDRRDIEDLVDRSKVRMQYDDDGTPYISLYDLFYTTKNAGLHEKRFENIKASLFGVNGLFNEDGFGPTPEIQVLVSVGSGTQKQVTSVLLNEEQAISVSAKLSHKVLIFISKQFLSIRKSVDPNYSINDFHDEAISGGTESDYLTMADYAAYLSNKFNFTLSDQDVNTVFKATGMFKTGRGTHEARNKPYAKVIHNGWFVVKTCQTKSGRFIQITMITANGMLNLDDVVEEYVYKYMESRVNK